MTASAECRSQQSQATSVPDGRLGYSSDGSATGVQDEFDSEAQLATQYQVGLAAKSPEKPLQCMGHKDVSDPENQDEFMLQTKFFTQYRTTQEKNPIRMPLQSIDPEYHNEQLQKLEMERREKLRRPQSRSKSLVTSPQGQVIRGVPNPQLLKLFGAQKLGNAKNPPGKTKSVPASAHGDGRNDTEIL